MYRCSIGWLCPAFRCTVRCLAPVPAPVAVLPHIPQSDSRESCSCSRTYVLEKQGFLSTRLLKRLDAFQRGLTSVGANFRQEKTFFCFSSCPVAPPCLLSPPKGTDECVDFLQHLSRVTLFTKRTAHVASYSFVIPPGDTRVGIGRSLSSRGG